MRDSTGVQWYTIAEAALAAGRHRRQIERWLEGGLSCQTVQGVRYISEPVLFAQLRSILRANPQVVTRRERKR